MPRLSRAEDEARRRVAELAARGPAPTDLAGRLLSVLDRVVPSDGGRIFAVDPATLLIKRLLGASDDDEAAREEWLREVYLNTPEVEFGQFPWLMRAGISVVALQERPETSWGYPASLRNRLPAAAWRETYHRYASPPGGCLLVSLRDGGQWVATLGLHRRQAGASYRVGEVELLRRLAPTLGRAFGAALRRDAAQCAAVGLPSAAGLLVLDARNRLTFSTPGAERWCDALGDVQRRPGLALPAAVWSVVRAARASVGQSSVSIETQSTSGPLRVEATLGTQPGSVAVVLSTPPRPRPPTVPDSWPLTPAERDVVAQLVGGLTNRQIADRLCVSENTVQTHLRRVYDKLDVHSRGELVARYFREAFWAEPGGDEAFS